MFCCTSRGASLLRTKLSEALSRRLQCRVQPVLGALGVEVHPPEGLHVVGREHAVVEQPVLDFVQQVGVGLLRQQGGLVVRLEGLPDLFGLVGEVEHRRALLAGVRAVQAGQRLDRVHPTELLIHVHRMQQWLIESGLELAGDHQEAVLRLVKLGCRLPLAITRCRPAEFMPDSV